MEMSKDGICNALDDISLYFYGCYRNAGCGTKACERFHNWMCAADEAKKMIERLATKEADDGTV